jgi:acyl-CoA synthetase (AMP-forming)/AMP-acid ligase II
MAGSGEVVTFAQLNDRSNQLAQLLYGRGLRPGDGMSIFMENNARYLEAAWAAQRSGLYFTAISSRLTPPEVEYLLDDSGSHALVTSRALGSVAAEAVRRLPRLHTRLMCHGAVEGFEPYEEVVAAQPARPLSDEREGADMLYSSGTTGRPKGIRRPLPVIPAGQAPDPVTLLCQGLYGATSDSVYLSPAPQYHSAPLRFSMAMQRIGCTVVIMEHFDPEEYLTAIERYRVTHTQLVPTMFVRMLKLPEEIRRRYDVSSLRCAIHAAAPCPVPVKRQMIEWWGPVIHEYYAGTEGNGFTAITSEDWLAHPGSVGRALVGKIHIVDDDGLEVPTGTPGAIYFEGDADFEYHNDPEKTRSSRNDQGWSTIGDVGYLDDEGHLYLTDRKAFMIISGGVNIYPQEAENVLVTHPKVMDVAVFGVPNDEMGEEVKAVVQPVDMADAGPELERELIAYCKGQLATLKCPRSVDFEAELPRHATGKLYKRLLRDRYWTGRESRIV